MDPVSSQLNPNSVLFACRMNSIRSPMAAGILRYLAGRRIYVRSAGVRPGEPDQFAISVMEEIGIDISGHVPRTLDDLNDTSFDLIISLAPEAHHKALEFTRSMSVTVDYWPTMDPSDYAGSRDQILSQYRNCRDQLFRRIKGHFAFLSTHYI